MDEIVFRRREVRKKEGSNGVLNIFVSVLLLVLSAFLVYNIAKSIQITQQKYQILRQAEEDVAKLRIKNIQLVMDKDNVETKEYIETEARNRLNFSKKNEIIFVISDMAWESAKRKLDTILYVEGRKEIKPVWKEWSEFMFM